MTYKYSKNFFAATLLVLAAMLPMACSSGDMDGFEKTEKGLYYNFEKQNPEGQQLQEGDVWIGEMTVKFDTVTLFDNTGNPQRIAQASANWELKVGEGLMMMHVGDVATFAMDADSVAQIVGAAQMHPNYNPNTGQKIYYKINLTGIVTKEDLAKEQAEFMAKVQMMKDDEPGRIRDFVKANNITVKPTADGLYIILKEKGNGEKVTKGQEVTVHYTGCLLDGTKFDSSVDRNQPFSFKIGEGQVIQGWDKGLIGQTVGSKLQLVIPSAMAYGERGAGGGQILPYTPLVFDVEIISVK